MRLAQLFSSLCLWLNNYKVSLKVDGVFQSVNNPAVACSQLFNVMNVYWQWLVLRMIESFAALIYFITSIDNGTWKMSCNCFEVAQGWSTLWSVPRAFCHEGEAHVETLPTRVGHAICEGRSHATYKASHTKDEGSHGQSLSEHMARRRHWVLPPTWCATPPFTMKPMKIDPFRGEKNYSSD